MIRIKKKENVEFPRTYQDYLLEIEMSKLPKGVEIGFVVVNRVKLISWNKLLKV